MSRTTLTPDLIEKMAERFSTASEQFVKDVERQIHKIDKRIKSFVDQGEAVTTRLVESLDKEMRSQITSLRKEVERLSGELAAMRPAGRPAAAPKAAVKPAVKPAAKTPAKTASARKSPAKKAASTRPPAKAGVRKAPVRRVAA
jgi:hypothetical protein